MIKQGGGRIINLSSISGLRARADGTGAYCISKAALNMMTQVMARELAPHNILVNAIAPGSIKTDFSRVNWTDPERKAQRIREIELKRFGEPEEVVGIALFLASEASSFVTGEIIRVDGGQTIIKSTGRRRNLKPYLQRDQRYRFRSAFAFGLMADFEFYKFLSERRTFYGYTDL